MPGPADSPPPQNKPEGESKPTASSGKATDHLANERTFLAWIRTGLATITFGFVIERFGLVVRELDPQTQSLFILSFRASTLIGFALTVLGVITLGFALVSYLRNRRAIEEGRYYSQVGFAIVMTVLAIIIGIILAVYLLFAS